MILDHAEIAQVARVLDTINPGRASAEHIADMIRSNLEPLPGNYISTAGWTAFTWMDEDLQIHVKVQIMPYSVERYIKACSKSETVSV